MAEIEITGLPDQTAAALIDTIASRDIGAGNDKEVTLQLIQDLMLAVQDSQNDGTNSIVAGSEKCYTDQNLVAMLASLRTKMPNPNTIGGGYSLTGLTPPAEVITVVATPADGRSMASGGTYDGIPAGTGAPIYEVRIFSPTEFEWQKDGGGFGAPITITGAAQALDDGVTVTFSIGTGWTAGTWTITITDAAYTANRTVEIDMTTGNVDIAGTVDSSHVFADIGEYFPNLAPGEIPVGTIVTEYKGEVAPASKNEYIAGVVSATAFLKMGNTSFTWSQRWLRDEFGRAILDDQGLQVVNPDFDPNHENIPRSDRPEDWTLVGLLGKVFVRVQEFVKPGDFVAADGTMSVNETRIRSMKITQKYSKAKGYAVAYCLIR